MKHARPGDLRATQIWMVGAITGREVDAADAARYVTGGPRMHAAARLDVYRSVYRARLVECLREDYPVLASAIPGPNFEELAHDYIRRHPSSSTNLNAFGCFLPSFCRDAAPLRGSPHRGFFSELAELEWALVEAIHAESSPALDIAPLEGAPPERWEKARFLASKTVRLLRFTHPVGDFYQASLDEESPPVPAAAPSAVLVYRRDTQVWRMSLSPTMLAVLAPLLGGETLGRTLSSLEASLTSAAEAGEVAVNLHGWFREWADAGIFAAVTL